MTMNKTTISPEQAIKMVNDINGSCILTEIARELFRALRFYAANRHGETTTIGPQHSIRWESGVTEYTVIFTVVDGGVMINVKTDFNEAGYEREQDELCPW